MNNLPEKIENTFSSVLSLEELKYAKAELGIKIYDLGEDFHKKLLNTITKIYADLGQTSTTEHKISLAISWCNELKKYWKGITLEQNEIALENGIRGKYEIEWFGINVVTFHKFITEFIKDEKTISAYNKQQQHKEYLKYKEMMEKNIDYTQERVIYIYDKWKETGNSECMNGVVYDWLKKHKFSKLSEQFRKDALKEAEAKLQIITEKEKESAFVRFNALEYELHKDPKKEQKEKNAMNLGKQICVNEIFKTIIESDLKTYKSK